MSKLRFNDGMVIDTDGPLRVTRKRDGYYVIGKGMCCPVESHEDGIEFIKKLNGEKNG